MRCSAWTSASMSPSFILCQGLSLDIEQHIEQMSGKQVANAHHRQKKRVRWRRRRQSSAAAATAIGRGGAPLAASYLAAKGAHSCGNAVISGPMSSWLCHVSHRTRVRGST